MIGASSGGKPSTVSSCSFPNFLIPEVDNYKCVCKIKKKLPLLLRGQLLALKPPHDFIGYTVIDLR